MSKSIFLPTLLKAVCILLLCLAIPCMSSADQVETIPESSQLTVDGSANNGTDPLTSLFQRLRGLIGRGDEKSASSAELTPVEIVSEITPPEKPSIPVTTEKTEPERLASENAQEKIAAERSKQNRAAAVKVAAEQVKLESGVMMEEIAPSKPETVRTLTPTVQATTSKQTTGSQPSSWNSLLALVGLHDDRQSIPPQELKNTPLQPGQDYIIGPGDVIGISVWRDESLTRTVVVLHDGKIQFPLIGEIMAEGKSVLQLKQEFVEKLSNYVVDTDISVDVKQSNSLVVYIIGKVNNPGRQILVSNTSVLQALSMAGGLNLFADKDDIKIFRQNNDRTVVYSFRYSKVVSGTYLDDNIMLKRGDVIVVP